MSVDRLPTESTSTLAAPHEEHDSMSEMAAVTRSIAHAVVIKDSDYLKVYDRILVEQRLLEEAARRQTISLPLNLEVMTPTALLDERTPADQ